MPITIYPATLCLTATGHNDEEFNWKTIEVQHDQ